ncbi:SWIM zinc finger family protein [Flaviaesturariibacter amylovorans]|uniref:SWIM zinc finger family protein n=1 Tax=Flaviaesturariibacter amylovorans TaxID=1084520 RepID=A0ABP8GZG3_9BACT
MNLTDDQILGLAPDEASRKAGQGLAGPQKWVTLGASEAAVWGECQGSGSKPYQAAIDLGSTAFKCSCPSRKFPCKHGIGLGLLHARQPALFAATEAPAWVQEWIGRRARKEEEKTGQKETAVDTAAQQKRQEARAGKVADGIAELLSWIQDIIRGGLMQLPDKPPAFWEDAARRLVDAQAPGLAGMVRGLGETAFYKDGWQTGFLERLLDLYLVGKGFQGATELGEDTVQDLRARIGFPVSQETLKEQTGITDTWIVLGRRTFVEDNLTTERYWLWGLRSDRYALLLQFLVRGQPPTLLMQPGMHLEAELVFYPGSHPLRTIIKRQLPAAPARPEAGHDSWRSVVAIQAAASAAFPVQPERPFVVRGLTPVPAEGGWWLRDGAGDRMALPAGYPGLWKLLAWSGGAPLDLALVGKGQIYEPLGLWSQNQYHVL